MKKVNIGFIGAGAFISSTHLITASRTDFINIAAVADLNEELLKKHSERYRVGYTTTDYKRVLADPEIALVVIGTKQDLHASLIVESLEAGKWVWCEKPMCETEEEAERILDAEQRNPGKLAIGFNRRFAPAYTAALEALKKRPRPWFVNYRMQAYCYDKKVKDNFYLHRPSIVYEGCHLLDLASFIFGEPPCRVFMSGPENSDNDCVLLEYRDGSRFQLLTTNTAGNGALGKEFAEFFAANLAVSVDNFVDLKLRGEAGEQDRIFPPAWGRFAADTERYGYDFLETLRAQLAQPDKQVVSMPPVRRGYRERPYEKRVAEIFAELEDRHWTERNFNMPKGWEEAFRHFALACLNQTEPANADGRAGKLANDIAFALLESKKSGLPQIFPQRSADCAAAPGTGN